MSYNCTLFQYTGFNAVNIPDSPQLLLDYGSGLSVPTLDIVQDRFLQTIRVHATYVQVKHVDYALVGDMYYIVTGVHMLNNDTAELSLLPDFITSAGGPSKLMFIDGVTERVHVDNDTYGKYAEHDPLMAPAEPLILDAYLFTDAGGAGHQAAYAFCEATIDLNANATQSDAKTYTDYTDPNNPLSVTVPQNSHLTSFTEFDFGPSSLQTSDVHMTGIFSPYYNGNVVIPVVKGIQSTRDLGTENAIISNYIVPYSYISSSNTVYDSTNHKYNKITGIFADKSITLPYEYGQYTPQNLKVLYSDFTKFGLLTATGSRVEFDPADIYDGGTSPTLKVAADPRSDGKPYFRYKNYKSLGSNGSDFFVDCVTGATWKQVPLVYQDKSGNALNTIKFQADRRVEDEKYKRSVQDMRLASIGSGFAGGASFGGKVGGDIGGIPGALAGSGIGGSLGAIAGYYFSDYSVDRLSEEYNRTATREVLGYALDTFVSAPELSQPYEADMTRDVLENGCWCYRFQYTENDMRRIDKLLNMYGYKHTKPLETSDFTGRQNFNYVSARGVQVCGADGSRLPRWWCEGIAAQLSAGARVWHTLPNPSYYT